MRWHIVDDMTDIQFRGATRADLAAIVALLADDPFGAVREETGPELAACYIAGFEAIARDPNQLLAVAELDGQVIGTMQLTFLPGIALRGAWRGQIEGVRVAATQRSQGVGAAFIAWAVAQFRARGCSIVQLTTNKARRDAHRFYARLGFKPSHEGFKLTLDPAT